MLVFARPILSWQRWMSGRGLAGRFQVALPPGDYRVAPDTMHNGQVLEPGQTVIGRYEAASPVDVTVHAHRFTRLAITYEERMGN